MNSEINVVPVDDDETFLYDIYDLPVPADVYVTLTNSLDVDIHGFFILGLFDGDDRLISSIDFEYAKIDANADIDLLYEMPDITPLDDESNTLKIIYSKYFSSMPSGYDTINLQAQGIRNLSKSDEDNFPDKR